MKKWIICGSLLTATIAVLILAFASLDQEKQTEVTTKTNKTQTGVLVTGRISVHISDEIHQPTQTKGER